VVRHSDYFSLKQNKKMSYTDVANPNSVLARTTAIINGSAAKKATVIADIQLDREDVLYDRTTVQRQLARIADSNASLQARKAAKQSEIDSFTTIVAALPAGTVKDEFIQKKTLAEQDLYRLNIRTVNDSQVISLAMRFEDLSTKEAEMADLVGDLQALATPNP
jgi:hypothetical protein